LNNNNKIQTNQAGIVFTDQKLPNSNMGGTNIKFEQGQKMESNFFKKNNEAPSLMNVNHYLSNNSGNLNSNGTNIGAVNVQ
jgi:hypothetical protein